MKDKLLQIIEHYGLDKQLKYIHSEYFELDQAIIDYENLKDFNISDKEYLKKHIAEELADVMVMLEQFIVYFDIDNEQIEQIMVEKIDRQIKRMRGEENGLI